MNRADRVDRVNRADRAKRVNKSDKTQCTVSVREVIHVVGERSFAPLLTLVGMLLVSPRLPSG